MTSIVKRRRGNSVYYYLVKSARVNGKPKIVWQKYLGTAETIEKKLLNAAIPEIKLHTFQFGTLAAILAADEELGFSKAVETHTNKKKIEGLTVGQYMLLFIAGRAHEPVSKNGLEDWFDKSYLKFLWKFDHSLSCQNFLNHMAYLDDATMEKIMDDIAINLCSRSLKPTTLLFDTSNFYTYIDNGETIPKKSNSKDKRFDKNLIGLGLAVDQNNIPFFHETFPANESDKAVFKRTIDRIVDKLSMLKIDSKKLIVVIDRGCNNPDNIEAILDDMHIVGSLKKIQAKEFVEIPSTSKKFKHLYKTSKGKEVKSYRTTKRLYGRRMTVVVTWNEASEKKQRLRYEEYKKKFLNGIEAIQKRLKVKRRGRKPSEEGIRKEIEKLIPDNYVSVFKYYIGSNLDGKLSVRGWIAKKAENWYYKGFGKNIIFTDDHTMSTSDIVNTNNSRYLVEDDFKFLKNKLLIPIKPVYHRLDEPIKVHVFLCVVGMLFYRYLMWKTKKVGLSLNEFVGNLEGIRTGVIHVQETDEVKNVVEEMTPDQAKLFSALDMGRYIKD